MYNEQTDSPAYDNALIVYNLFLMKQDTNFVNAELTNRHFVFQLSYTKCLKTILNLDKVIICVQFTTDVFFIYDFIYIRTKKVKTEDTVKKVLPL